MGSKRTVGHLAALFTIIIWGTTFISTKVLLAGFRPVEILFFRFVMEFAVLLLVCPHRLKNVSRRQEVTFVLVLKEPVTWVSALGTVLAVAELFLPEYSGKGEQ